MISTNSPARPYRSHRMPACPTCRKRKIRCHIVAAGHACRFCQERGLSCQLEQNVGIAAGVERAVLPPPPPGKRRRIDGVEMNAEEDEVTENSLLNLSNVTDTSPEESSVLMNPTMAEDIEALEKYLTSQPATASNKTRPYSVVPSGDSDPVVYLSVLRRRQGLTLTREPGKAQREVMEQILRPYLDEVIDLYFTRLHPCFPVVDSQTFGELWRRDRASISSPLLCAIYASALVFWRCSPVLRCVPQPDMAFAWNQHVLAMHDDFLAPTVSTVHAALLDMVGRPVFGIQGNIVDAGRTVALAQSLGLHRDPSQWRAREHEKGVRIRLWWGVVVHDAWYDCSLSFDRPCVQYCVLKCGRSSIAHGTPPLIRSEFADVPFPEVSKVQQLDAGSQHTFTHLCRLTHTLAQVLPLVYTLGPSKDESQALRRLECDVDEWEQRLPPNVKLILGNPSTACNGSSSLHFCLLSVRLLLARLSLRVGVTCGFKNTISQLITNAERDVFQRKPPARGKAISPKHRPTSRLPSH